MSKTLLLFSVVAMTVMMMVAVKRLFPPRRNVPLYRNAISVTQICIWIDFGFGGEFNQTWAFSGFLFYI